MNLLFIFALIFIKTCESNELKCGYLDGAQQSVEFYCENYQQTLPANCTTSALYLISYCVKSKVTQLKIGGCDEDKITQFVHDFQNIRSLDISYSSLHSLNRFNETLDQLVELNMSHNHLMGNPGEFFAKNSMPRLAEIDLSYNEFRHVWGLPEALQKIDLSHNNLSLINYNELANVPNLEFIDLSYNLLEEIGHPNVFAIAKHFKTLQLQNNPYKEFNGRFLQLLKREVTVNCSWKNVKQFEMDDDVGKPIRVITTKNQTEGVRSTADKKLNIFCHEGSFERIEGVKFANNYVENIGELFDCLTPSLQKLALSGRFIEKLNLTSIERFENLTELTLNDGLLASFDFGAIEKLRNLQKLDISQNNLKQIVNLQHNPRSFIYELNLSGNFIGQIDANTFRKYSFLRELYLSNASLTFDNLTAFESLNGLQKLDISYNNLEKTNFTSGQRIFNKIQHFSAAHCNIANVSNLLKQFGSEISNVDLSGNPLQRLENIKFENITFLNMNLSRTKLSHISFDFEYVWRLDLSHNYLNNENLNLTAVRSWLMELRLNGNELTDVQQFNQFRDLQLISISNNRIPCKQLTQFISDWPKWKLIDNPLIQKHGDCSHVINFAHNLGFVGALIP